MYLVAQSPMQPNFEHFQRCGFCSHSVQPVPGLHHPHIDKFLPHFKESQPSSRELLFPRTAAGCVRWKPGAGSSLQTQVSGKRSHKCRERAVLQAVLGTPGTFFEMPETFRVEVWPLAKWNQ